MKLFFVERVAVIPSAMFAELFSVVSGHDYQASIHDAGIAADL